jgi:hypothetical protein
MAIISKVQAGMMAPLDGFSSTFDLPIPATDVITWIYEEGRCKDDLKPVFYLFKQHAL